MYTCSWLCNNLAFVTVKLFQVLLCIPYKSINQKSFVHTQLNDQNEECNQGVGFTDNNTKADNHIVSILSRVSDEIY